MNGNIGLLRNSSFLAGIFSVVIGVFWYLASFQMRDGALGDPNAARYFPWLVAAMCVVCGIILMVREMIQPTARKPVVYAFTSTYKAALIGSAAGVFYAVTFDPLGYLLSTSLFVGVIAFAYNGSSRWKSNVLLAIGFSIVVYFIFTLLGKPLVAFPEFLA